VPVILRELGRAGVFLALFLAVGMALWLLGPA
jgi:hypothetical protein